MAANPELERRRAEKISKTRRRNKEVLQKKAVLAYAARSAESKAKSEENLALRHVLLRPYEEVYFPDGTLRSADPVPSSVADPTVSESAPTITSQRNHD